MLTLELILFVIGFVSWSLESFGGGKSNIALCPSSGQ
jgi:hypothetical protein